MGTGWRRAFCNSITIRDHNHGVEKMKLRSNKQQHEEEEEKAVEDPTPASSASSATPPPPASASADDKCSMTTTPTSAKSSPSVGLALLLALRLSRIGCGIETGLGSAVFTAECHAFHVPCIAAHVRNNGRLSCPVCSAAWLHAPLLAVSPAQVDERDEDKEDYSDDEPLDPLPEDPLFADNPVERIVEAKLLSEAAVVSSWHELLHRRR